MTVPRILGELLLDLKRAVAESLGCVFLKDERTFLPEAETLQADWEVVLPRPVSHINISVER